MCACSWDYACLKCRDTPRDPLYLLSHLPDGEDDYQTEPHVSEYEVRDGR